jgi:hypothetical protein
MIADPEIDALWVCAPNHLASQTFEEIAERPPDGKGTLKGVACEKPLARNVAEAKRVLELVNESGLNHGYLENQVFSDGVNRGRDILWARGRKTDRPALPGPRGRGTQRPPHALVLAGRAAGRRRPERHDVPFGRDGALHADRAGQAPHSIRVKR